MQPYDLDLSKGARVMAKETGNWMDHGMDHGMDLGVPNSPHMSSLESNTLW